MKPTDADDKQIPDPDSPIIEDESGLGTICRLPVPSPSYEIVRPSALPSPIRSTANMAQATEKRTASPNDATHKPILARTTFTATTTITNGGTSNNTQTHGHEHLSPRTTQPYARPPKATSSSPLLPLTHEQAAAAYSAINNRTMLATEYLAITKGLAEYEEEMDRRMAQMRRRRDAAWRDRRFVILKGGGVVLEGNGVEPEEVVKHNGKEEKEKGGGD